MRGTRATIAARGGLTVILAAAVVAVAAASVPELSYRAWTAEDGLAQGSVYAIAQTPDGYLWIATLDGLVRFDGARMKVFSRSDDPELDSNRILALHVDREGSLWVGTEDGGIVRRKAGKFEAFHVPDKLPGSFVTAFAEDAQGRLWASTSAGIVRFQDGRWAVDLEPRGTGERQPEAFLVGWRGPGVLRFLEPSGAFTDYPVPVSEAYAVHRDPRGAVWVRTGETAFLRLAGGGAAPVHVPALGPRPVEPLRFAAARGAHGREWLLVDGRLHVFENGRWHAFAGPLPAEVASPITMFEDREGSLWIGGETGLAQGVSTPLRMLVPGGDRFENSFYPVAESRDGRLWAGSRSYAFLVAGDRFARLDALRGIGNVTAIEPEHDGTMLLASPGTGVHRVTPDLRSEPLYRTAEAVFDIVRDRAGALWLATGLGVIRVDAAGTTRFGKQQGLAPSSVTVLLEGEGGGMWAGGFGGLSRIEGDRVTSWRAADGLSSEKIRALHEDAQDSLWIGTYDGGLMRLRDGKLVAIRRRNGLFDDGVFAILDDGMGRFWMTGNRGIHFVERAELDAFADGRISSVTARSLGRGEGMLSLECNGGQQPAGFRRADGTLIFPTQRGLAVVDPRGFHENPVVPPVVFEEIASERRTHAVARQIVLGPDERQLEVRFTAPSFVRAAQARFRYRLEGLDRAWVETGSDRLARYAYVPPGHYLFRVLASNGDGKWNEEGASLAVVVRPAWWETVWLRLAAALAVAGVVALGVRRRFVRLARRRAEQDLFSRQLIESQEAERKRIAGDLHDGIQQTLVVIRNRALLSLRDGSDVVRTRKQSEQIVDAAASGLDEIHKVIHNLRPYQLDRLGLTRAVEAIVEKAGEASDIAFASAIDPLDGVFSAGDDIAVYRILQEAVNNVVRHSGAKTARLEVRVAPKEVELVVADDGRGFDPDTLPPDKRGMGLSGIAERARILGGRQAVQSSPGKGTRITVWLPRREATG